MKEIGRLFNPFFEGANGRSRGLWHLAAWVKRFKWFFLGAICADALAWILGVLCCQADGVWLLMNLTIITVIAVGAFGLFCILRFILYMLRATWWILALAIVLFALFLFVFPLLHLGTVLDLKGMLEPIFGTRPESVEISP
jgi:hypothetical protein